MYPEHYYELVEDLESRRVRIIVLVHSIFQTEKNSGTIEKYIRVSKFWRRRDIALLNDKMRLPEEGSEETDDEICGTDREDNDPKSGTLFLWYIDWEERGSEEDAEDLNVEDVKDVVEECRIEWPDDNFDDGELPSYPVDWAFAGAKDHTYFRRLPTGPEEKSTYHAKKKPDVVDLFSGMGGFSRGFSDAGFEIVAGVDRDPFAMSTFMVLAVNSYLTQP
jgi:hypothetical protein